MADSRLTKREIEVIGHFGQELELAAGQIVYRKGSPSESLYYIKSGRVRIFDGFSSGREVTVDVIETGHIFGESAFAGCEEGTPRPINVMTVTDTVLIRIPVCRLAEAAAKDPQLLLHLLQLCSDSMDRLTRRLEEQCMLDRYGKTASYLLDVTAVQSKEKGTLDGNVPYTHSQLAVALGLNRTTVSEVLKYFDRKRWIFCGYGKVQVTDRAGLEAFVRGQMP